MLRIRAMARSMIAVLVCALMVSSLLVTVTRAQDDSLAGLQQQSLGEYQQEEAQEIQFNMQMQKLQAEGKMADKASGAQIGGGRRLVQDLTALYQQDEAENIELNQQMQKQQAEGYGEDASIGSRRRLVQDLRYISKNIHMDACMHACAYCNAAANSCFCVHTCDV